MALRLFDNPLTLQRPFDYVALESVLYQVFLTSTGLWTDDACDDDFNLDFWLRAEIMLQTTRLLPDEPHSVNSPVLGVPVELFRLTVQTKQILQQPEKHRHVVAEIQEAVQAWEEIVKLGEAIEPTVGDDSDVQHNDYYESASYLYALIVSLLLQQVYTNSGSEISVPRQLPSVVSRNAWQIEKAIEILQHHQADEIWGGCYIGNWCVYTLGFFLYDPEDIDIVRTDLICRWEATKFMQTPRFLADLENVWAARSPRMDDDA